jgi:hypothetical protein
MSVLISRFAFYSSLTLWDLDWRNQVKALSDRDRPEMAVLRGWQIFRYGMVMSGWAVPPRGRVRA